MSLYILIDTVHDVFSPSTMKLSGIVLVGFDSRLLTILSNFSLCIGTDEEEGTSPSQPRGEKLRPDRTHWTNWYLMSCSL